MASVTDVHQHPDWAAFLAAIRADPKDDTARLVVADWLDEHGEGERAEFIRVQVALAGLSEPEEKSIGGSLVRSRAERTKSACLECRRIESDDLCPFHTLSESEDAGWYGGVLVGILEQSEGSLPAGTIVHRVAERPAHLPRQPEAYVSRGFIGEVCCSAADWLERSEAILSAHPIEHVRLHDTPDLWCNAGGLYFHVSLADDGAGVYVERFVTPAEMNADERRATVLELLSLGAPGVEFELPPPAPTHLGGFTSGTFTTATLSGLDAPPAGVVRHAAEVEYPCLPLTRPAEIGEYVFRDGPWQVRLAADDNLRDAIGRVTEPRAVGSILLRFNLLAGVSLVV